MFQWTNNLSVIHVDCEEKLTQVQIYSQLNRARAIKKRKPKLYFDMSLAQLQPQLVFNFED